MKRHQWRESSQKCSCSHEVLLTTSYTLQPNPFSPKPEHSMTSWPHADLCPPPLPASNASLNRHGYSLTHAPKKAITQIGLILLEAFAWLLVGASHGPQRAAARAACGRAVCGCGGTPHVKFWRKSQVGKGARFKRLPVANAMSLALPYGL